LRVVARARTFLRSEPSLATTSFTPARRLVWAIRGLVHRNGFVVASALSFDTVLAIVPLLALVVAALKGLGSYDTLREDIIRPWLEHTFPPSNGGISTIAEAFDRILALVDSADVGSLGIAGLVSLLYVVWMLLYATQSALDDILDAPKRRSIGRTLADYAAFLFIAPFSIISLSALFSFTARVEAGVVPPAIGVHFVSIAVAALGVMVIYVVMPSRRLHVAAMALGAFVAGALVYAIFLVQVKAQVGVIRYNILYSGFAAIPLFLLWVFATWVALLFGAEVAAVQSDEASYCERIVRAVSPPQIRERAAIVAFVAIVRRHLEGGPPLLESELAAQVGVSERTLRRTLAPLLGERILLRGEDGLDAVYALARDPDRITPAEILAIVRGESEPEATAGPIDPVAEQLLVSLVEHRDSGPFAKPLGALFGRETLVAGPSRHAKGGASSPPATSE
jgi:membrane protein